jgi:hypothetical protein
MLHMYPTHLNVNIKISPKINPLNVDIKISIICSKGHAEILCCSEDSVHLLCLYLLHFPTLYPLLNLPLPEGQEGTALEPSEQEMFFAVL